MISASTVRRVAGGSVLIAFVALAMVAVLVATSEPPRAGHSLAPLFYAFFAIAAMSALAEVAILGVFLQWGSSSVWSRSILVTGSVGGALASFSTVLYGLMISVPAYESWLWELLYPASTHLFIAIGTLTRFGLVVTSIGVLAELVTVLRRNA